jgi:glyoxylase-like metal-dependent hydrolase (beta-lactamase superfamily II)
LNDTSTIYFKQLLTGKDIALNDPSARQMANFVYLIGDPVTRECVAVDAAWDVDGILDIVRKDDMKLVGALVTHYHPDHVGGSIFGMNIVGLARLMEKNPVPVYVNKLEAEGLRKVTGLSASDLRLAESEEKIRVGSVEISCLHTPGHTPGSQCFRVKDSLIAGDTLFLQGCGRVDFPGGDSEEMYHTLTRRLAKIQDEVVLYPGHNYGGAHAPMEHVRATNSYLQIRSLEDWLALMGG